MPFTPKQVRLLLSKVSPLTESKKNDLKAELHAEPSIGHAKKGSEALKKKPPAKRKPAANGNGDSESYSYNWRNHMGRP